METRTVVDQVEVTASGHIQVRMRKEVVDNGEVVSFGYHRTAISPGADCDAQMTAVNAHLSKMGNASVSEDDRKRVKDIAAAAWTQDCLAAWDANLKNVAK